MNEYTIYRAFVQRHSISVVTEKGPDEDGLIVLTEEEYAEAMRAEVPGDGEAWDVVSGNGLVVVYPSWEMEFNDQRINKYVRRREENNV